MSDLRNNQYLLHKLALYGAGDGPEDDESLTSGRSASAAPEELSINLMEKFPGAVHKFDNEGNLPLHMAATSGNLTMIRQMGFLHVFTCTSIAPPCTGMPSCKDQAGALAST